MSETIKRDITEYDEMQERIADLKNQLNGTRAEIARLTRCLARKDGIIKGLAYAIRCNGVSGNEIGGIEE